MVTATELVLLVLGGILLATLLTRWLTGQAAQQRPSLVPPVRLLRSLRSAAGREETRLVVGDTVLLTATDDGLRLAQYTDEVQQLEEVAARLAGALGVTVELARLGGRAPDNERGVPVRTLPRGEPISEPSVEIDEETPAARGRNQSSGTGRE